MMATLNARLKALGMNYAAYLASDHWRETRRRYRASDMPQSCVGCGESRVDLHHITYARVGREMLEDLLPLCRECHGKVHAYANTHSTNLSCIAKIAREVFGWSRAQTRQKLARFNAVGIQHEVDNSHLLTNKQRLRMLRKSDPENPAFWTSKQKRARGLTG